ncbi:hypothetical protein ACFOSV_11950 [Algoriphagus namhaensis]|uniref:Glycosyltransferase RgtA/B/C/D-like domain-containing protein n=1 Tax=Algoriphagus namhaensis TaxID=915353 RepID=A0ABV8ASD5_9BACT
MTRAYQILTLLFVLASILLVILAIPRGFDFTDEGLYVLLADPKQQNVGGIFNYDLFFKLIHRFTGFEFGIIGLRIIRFLSYFLGAWALTRFWQNLYLSGKIFRPVFILVLAGLMAGYSFLPPSLSYNSISVVGACFWLAILSKPKPRSWDFLSLGIVLLFLFYSKATFCILVTIVSLIYFWDKKMLNIRTLSLILIPFLLIETFCFFIFETNAILRILATDSFVFLRVDYSFPLLLKYTGVGIFWSLIPGLLFFLAGLISRKKSQLRIPSLLMAVASIPLVFYFTWITSEWNHAFLLILCALLGWKVAQGNIYCLDRKKQFFFILLLLLPFAMHFGSNVYWLRLGIHYAVFWVLAIQLLNKETSVSSFSQFHLATTMSIFVLIGFGIWIMPFEGTSLELATEEWEYKTGKKIKLNSVQVNMLSTLRDELDDIGEGEIAAFYRNPGILYLLDYRSPFIPGYWTADQARHYLKEGNELSVILENDLGAFPFDSTNWVLKQELSQPNGERLRVLWKK